MRSYDRHDLLGAGFAGYVFGLITACLVAMSAGGCAQAVAAEADAGRRVARCSRELADAGPAGLRDLPEPPDVLLFEKPDDADLSRFQRQLADLVQWHADVRHVMSAYATCLRKLSEAH